MAHVRAVLHTGNWVARVSRQFSTLEAEQSQAEAVAGAQPGRDIPACVRPDERRPGTARSAPRWL
jgi:hypothetical protein